MLRNKKSLVCDWQFITAICAAPVVWLLLYYIDSPSLSVDWVFTATWLFLSLVLLQPILEECVFRGLLQGWLIQRQWGKKSVLGLSQANIVCSTVFVSMHLFYHAPLMALMVMLPSLIFGHFRDRYHGWLMPAIILHVFYNLGYFLLYAPV